MTLHYKRKKIMIGLLIIFIGISHFSYALETMDIHKMVEYTSIITANIDPQNGDGKSIVNVHATMKNLCITLSNNDFHIGKPHFTSINPVDKSQDNGISYNAQESLFVTIICNSLLGTTDSIETKQSNSLFPLNTILKYYNIRGLQLACLQNPGTNSTTNTDCEIRPINQTNNSTDYPFIFYNLIKDVLNDITNLIIARSYGVIKANTSIKNLVNAYTVNQFGVLGNIPEAKNYQQTTKQLEQYIKLGQQIQESLTLLNIKKDLNEIEDLPHWSTFLNYDAQKLDTTGVDTLPQYHGLGIDLLYNELFFYQLFNGIYNEYLTSYRSIGPVPQVLQGYTIGQAIQIQRNRLNTQESQIITAIEQTIRQLNNLIALYPIHIGLLMYQEDLLTIRNNLAKIYLPLHQLHFKLENIQGHKK